MKRVLLTKHLEKFQSYFLTIFGDFNFLFVKNSAFSFEGFPVRFKLNFVKLSYVI